MCLAWEILYKTVCKMQRKISDGSKGTKKYRWYFANLLHFSKTFHTFFSPAFSTILRKQSKVLAMFYISKNYFMYQIVLILIFDNFYFNTKTVKTELSDFPLIHVSLNAAILIKV